MVALRVTTILAAVLGMLASGYTASSGPFAPVAQSEAANIVGAADCYETGEDVDICTWWGHWVSKGTNDGQALGPEAAEGRSAGTLQCPCDSTSNITVCSATCSGSSS